MAAAGKKQARAATPAAVGKGGGGAATAKRALLGLLVVAVAAAVLPWDPSLTPGPILVGAPPPSADVLRPVLASEGKGYSRRTVRFPCGPSSAAKVLGRTPPAAPSPDNDVSCEAWLYLPEGPDAPAGAAPVVIMAHGMGGQRDMGLDRFASVFVVRARVAVLAFDYRTFGGSGGAPRNWASPSRHVEDWASAWAHVSGGGLGARADARNVALWGTSFAGGHAIVLASRLGRRVKALISVVPHLSGPAAARASVARRGLPQSVRMISAGLHDRLREALGAPAAYLKLVGPPGSTAVMQLDAGETAEYFSKHPRVYHGGWRNLVRARLTLEMGGYSPIKFLPNVEAPVLVVAATNDTLCPVEEVRRAPSLNPRVRLLLRDCTHFELYRGAHFDAVIDTQVGLLRSALWGEGGGGGGGGGGGEGPDAAAAPAAADKGEL